MGKFNLDAGTLLSGISNIGMALGSIGSAKRMRKHQEKLMDKQAKIDRENYQTQLADQRQLIDEERAYQSIGAQMQRAKDGGVSPLAALGVNPGSAMSASAPSHSGVSIPSPGSDSLQDVTQMGAAGIRQLSQIAKDIAETRRIQKEEQTEIIKQKGIEIDNLIKEMEKNGWTEKRQKELDIMMADYKDKMASAGWKEEQIKDNIATRDARIRNLNTGSDLNTATANLNTAKYVTEEAMREINKYLANAKIRLTEAQVFESMSASNLNEQQVYNLIEEEQLTVAQKQKVWKEVDLFQDRKREINARIAQIESDTNLNESKKQALISQTVVNYTNSVTGFADTLSKIVDRHKNKQVDSDTKKEIIDSGKVIKDVNTKLATKLIMGAMM